MGKIIWNEPKEDDRIFKTGFIISNPKVTFYKKNRFGRVRGAFAGYHEKTFNILIRIIMLTLLLLRFLKSL